MAFSSLRGLIRLALACKVLVITGGPGVGKTTIVKGILRFSQPKGPDSSYAPLRAALPNE
jgi:exodeoxyribonuclease V alpha subunit